MNDAVATVAAADMGKTRERDNMTKVYWRRLNQFPAKNIRDIEVVTDPDPQPEVGSADMDWHEISISSLDNADIEIDDALGLCGGLHSPVLIADAIIISGAIHQYLGVSLTPWDYECLWTRRNMDSHNQDDVEMYFRAMHLVYGEHTAEMARRRYAEDSDSGGAEDGDDGNGSGDGSANYLRAIERGLIVGDAAYADVEYHHMKTTRGWALVPMHNPAVERVLTEIIEGGGTAVTAEVWLVRDGDGDYSMVRTVGDEYQHIPIPPELVVEFDQDDEDWDGTENCYSAVIGRP